jgi:hypothetical protein
MERLPLAPIYKADCETKGSNAYFKGDAGSVYLVECPEGCTQQPGNIWGTGVYTLDSSICRAAIHSGVNQDIGGLIELVIKEG